MKSQKPVQCAAVAALALGMVAVSASAGTVDFLVGYGGPLIRYDGETQEFLGDFTSGGPPGILDGFAFGPDGHLYLVHQAGQGGDAVHRYNGQTGVYIGQFAGGPEFLDQPTNLSFGPDGNLYVTSSSGDSIVRFNGATGEFIDVFTSGAQLSTPLEHVFGPDGNLYVANQVADNVLRFDGTSGTFIDVFADSELLDMPGYLEFGPDGLLYVSSFLGGVTRFDDVTGAFIDEFISQGNGGLAGPSDLLFLDDGSLLVADFFGGPIRRYDGVTGESLGDFIPSQPFSHPRHIGFIPEPVTLVMLLAGGVLCLRRHRR